jgi:hypothetical protein
MKTIAWAAAFLAGALPAMAQDEERLERDFRRRMAELEERQARERAELKKQFERDLERRKGEERRREEPKREGAKRWEDLTPEQREQVERALRTVRETLEALPRILDEARRTVDEALKRLGRGGDRDDRDDRPAARDLDKMLEGLRERLTRFSHESARRIRE